MELWRKEFKPYMITLNSGVSEGKQRVGNAEKSLIFQKSD